VTFVFTDLESSPRLWEEHPEAMQGALARHDAILCGAVEDLGLTKDELRESNLRRLTARPAEPHVPQDP